MLGIEDIARELKVSPSLVSKVLNGRLGTTRVSSKTLEAIRQHADVIGYRKHNSASALAMGKHNVIG
ncbi:LacI family DNA-binding transcriptional regulator, partial [Klebsiella pneumoniae]|nr:LacI family DNA-binding transcriptional regulator [Klebsiella pneumoniae]